ncbi:hypothetical protein FHS55_002204 [Angulomicrobium tetraedrale]|uniref:Uncharacterized protein n=1 Tax=Ancylobacter tetraedralis TaxID=217068 RepID=A0A839ZA53_9HYPH|nr:hypothetical protein [Ancylobacter tetraedralis]MBB3771605.1 hypothetical protein [Ancylobacter tetraedralis]
MNAAPQTLTPDERQALSAIADVLIPRFAHMPSASDVELCGPPIDRALGARPDLLATARSLAKQARGSHAEDIVREIEVDDPKTLNAVLQLMAGAYFMLPEVRSILGYAGQERR